MAKGKGKKKIRRSVTKAIAHIKATFNNTIITITDTAGETLCSASAGQSGFKGSRKSTPFAAQLAADASTRACDARTGARGRPGRARSIEVFLTSDAAAMTALRAREMVARDLATRGCVPSEVAWSVEHGQVGEVIVRR